MGSKVEVDKKFEGGVTLGPEESEAAWQVFQEMRSQAEQKRKIRPRALEILASERKRQREEDQRDFSCPPPTVYTGSDIGAILIDTPLSFSGRDGVTALDYFRRYCPTKETTESDAEYLIRKKQWQQDHSFNLPELESIAISSSWRADGRCSGKLSCILFEQSLVSLLDQGEKSLLLLAASEGGKVSACIIPQIRITGWEWGIANDSQDSREIFSFESDRVIPWTLISATNLPTKERH
jgi:hypothetical protein